MTNTSDHFEHDSKVKTLESLDKTWVLIGHESLESLENEHSVAKSYLARFIGQRVSPGPRFMAVMSREVAMDVHTSPKATKTLKLELHDFQDDQDFQDFQDL